jgi:8-oxo-dGTP diphosphatase
MTESDVRQSHSHQDITIAVDNCIFTIKDDKLHLLLIQMKQKFPGKWALPGGLVENNETLDQAAMRILKDQTGVSNIYLEQLYSFSTVNRDQFGRVISVAYYALVPSANVKLQTTTKYSDVKWVEFAQLPPLAYDHAEIAEYAKKRLENKISYTNAVWSLLPDKFTLRQLQAVYEAILGVKLDKRNFRKKLLSLGLLEEVGEKALLGAHRPASLYKFKTKEAEIVKVL